MVAGPISDPVAAINAYKNTASAKIAGTDGEHNASDFGAFIRDAAQSSIQTLRQGDEMAQKAVVGEATLPDVVQAVTAAELTLQQVVAVRDKLVSAYKDIMQMPI